MPNHEKNPERVAIRRRGAIKRWGEGHGKTVTVRIFQDVADLLRDEIPEKSAQNLSQTLFSTKLDEKMGGSDELLLGASRL